MAIELPVSQIENLRMFEDEDGYMLGTMTIAGVPYHVNFVRVGEDEDGCQICDGKSEVAKAFWDDLCTIYDSAFHLTEIPGHAGKWAALIHPYGH